MIYKTLAMKTIKTLVSIAFMLAYVSMYAQKNSSVEKKSIYTFSVSNDFKQQEHVVDFSKINFSKKEYVFTAYNNHSNLYDTYFIGNNTFSLSSSSPFYTPKSNLLTTLFIEKKIAILQNNSLFFDNSNGPIKDSFNPYGTNDVRKAVVGGFLGLLFNN